MSVVLPGLRWQVAAGAVHEPGAALQCTDAKESSPDTSLRLLHRAQQYPLLPRSRVCVGQPGWRAVMVTVGGPIRARWSARRRASGSRYRPFMCRTRLWVPIISSTSRDQAIFVDHATGPSLPSYAVLAENDRSG